MKSETSSSGLSGLTRFLLASACFIIVVSGLQAAAGIIVPILLSALFAMLCAPLLFWLQRRGIPKFLALIIVILAIIVIGVALTTVIGTSLSGLTSRLPFYEARLREQEALLLQYLENFGLDPATLPLPAMLEPGVIARTIGGILTGLGTIAANSLLILFTVFFMLLEASGLPAKVEAAVGSRTNTLTHFRRFNDGLRNYLVIKTLISLATGVIVTISLIVLEIDFPVLWGFIAFLLNYIPTIGSLLAALPAIMLGLVQHGIESALLVTAVYFIVNQLLGGLLEPRVMGLGLNLSTLVVFLSLVFWGWIFGAAGVLLAVPLTLLLKILLESSDETRWLAVLLAANPSAEGTLVVTRADAEPPGGAGEKSAGAGEKPVSASADFESGTSHS